ncbi:MAG: methionine synthase, partial [bacterium]
TIDWKKSLGAEWRQYEKIFPALAKSNIGQVSVECIHSHVPLHVLSLLDGKDVLVGVIDVATDKVETLEEIVGVIDEVMRHVPRDHIVACTNCGMAPMRRGIAEAKLVALGAGTKLAREKFG